MVKAKRLLWLHVGMVVLAVTMVGLQARVMIEHEFATGQVVVLCGWIFLAILWSVLAVFYYRSSGTRK